MLTSMCPVRHKQKDWDVWTRKQLDEQKNYNFDDVIHQVSQGLCLDRN